MKIIERIDRNSYSSSTTKKIKKIMHLYFIVLYEYKFQLSHMHLKIRRYFFLI